MGKASTRAQNRYIAKAYDRINLTVPKGQKETIQAHATARSESVNGFINRAITETMARDASVSPSEAAGGPREAGVVSLPSEAYGSAQEAVETPKEATAPKEGG